MKKITVMDVARHAGVSQGTVSRVLTGKNWVSEEARAKVEASAKILGYVPNAMAQGLKAQRTRTVAAVVSDMSNPLQAEFLLAAEERLRAAGYQMLIANTRGRPAMECELMSTFRSGRVDGLLVAQADETNQDTKKALRSTGLPIVFHDREPGDLGDAVFADHQTGAHAVTRHLIGLGHKRIALLTPPPFIRPGRERVEGYYRALEEAGIVRDAKLVRVMDASSDVSFSEVKALLAQKNPPTAVISLATRMLAGALTAISSLGLEIPKDISIVGVGDTDLLRLHSPPITSLKWDLAQCGCLAAELLLERMTASGVEETMIPRTRYVSVELVLRHSTASPGKRS